MRDRQCVRGCVCLAQSEGEEREEEESAWPGLPARGPQAGWVLLRG